MLTTGLNFVMMHVADVAEATDFFTKNFDLEVDLQQPDFVQFKQPGGNGAVLAIGKGNTTPDIGTEFWWYVEDADKALATLQQRGVTIRGQLTTMPFGRTFSVEGPGGYVLYLLQLAQ
jgi:predicted enzyme related to lactoylglutathione lyase